MCFRSRAMAFPYRSRSPILKVSNKRKVAELLLEKGKIHRVRLTVDAFCDVANVSSPSCVWFKLRNHISSNLQYVKPSPLREFISSTNPENDVYRYVMAPIQENVYARGRIIATENIVVRKEEHRFVLVHFIDEGYAEWMDMNCLARMGDKLFTHPWQAFPVALFKSTPGVDFESLCENPNWTQHATRILADILEQYEYFRLKPVPNSERNLNNYYEYARVEVFGLSSDSDLVGESIAHRFSMEIFAMKGKIENLDIIARTWFDAKDHPILRSTPEEKLTEELIIAMPSWRRQFPIDFCPPELQASMAELQINGCDGENGDGAPADKKNAEENDEEGADERRRSTSTVFLQPYAEWDPDCPPNTYPKICSMTISYLRSKKLCNEFNEMSVCIQWESLKSPNEFYAFAMTCKADDPLHESYLKRLKWSETLDAFYGHYTNRRTIDAQIVMRVLRQESNPRVFAIYEYNDERTTGSYRRVEVLAVRDVHAIDYSEEFCRVRFLDVGGSNIVPLASLLAIHSQHCNKPPMSIQLSLGGIVPPDGALTWAEDSCHMFRKLARTDMKMNFQFVRLVPDNIRTAYNDPPQTWPGVFEVSRLRLDDVDRSVEEEMVEKKCAVFRQ